VKIIRAVKIKLDIPFSELKFTFEAYAKAFNLICKRGWDDSDCNEFSLQKKTYQDCKSIGLPAQLCISVKSKAAEALKAIRTFRKKDKEVSCPVTKHPSIRLDCNSYTLWLESRTLSILTCEGRKKLKLNIPKYFEKYLAWKHTSADLFSTKKGNIFLHIVFKKDVEDVEPIGKFIGIDRGTKKLAVTSDNRFFRGGIIKQISKRYLKLRRQLQSKETRSAKRHLVTIRGQERRFKADVSHCISKQIIAPLRAGDTIVLEKLTDIRTRARCLTEEQKAAGMKTVRKEQRREFNSWSFLQIEKFLNYKTAFKGIGVVYVDARYTSQRCSKCGHIHKQNRKKQAIFKCKHCGYSCNADLNAARNICLKYLDATGYLGKAAVNQPNGGCLTTNAPSAFLGSRASVVV
jgi:IS605 OrfB family transposase